MRGGSRSVPIVIDDFHFPVAAISVQCLENRGVTKGIYAFVHGPYEKRVWNGYCIQLVIAPALSYCSLLFWHEYDWCRQFGLGQLNNIHRYHLCRFHVSQILIRVGRLGMILDGLGVLFLKLIRLVFSCSNETQMSVPHVIEFRTHI